MRVFVSKYTYSANRVGKLMKVAITIAFILAAFVASPASAEPRNDTPHALACMKKYGFTYAEWRAYSVPAYKADPYRACRDAGETRKGATCSKLVAQCVAFNKRGGYDTKRCETYRAPCMATGVYKDRNRTIVDVIRR